MSKLTSFSPYFVWHEALKISLTKHHSMLLSKTTLLQYPKATALHSGFIESEAG